MAGERRTTGDHRAATAVSVRRLESKVDELTKMVVEDRRATTEVGRRIDALNLNGSAAALKRLADNVDQLLRLAQVAPTVVDVVEREADRAAAHRYLRRLFNPLKPAGAVLWLAVASAITASIWKFIVPGIHP